MKIEVTANGEGITVWVEPVPFGFAATVDGEYDGAPDGGGFVGFGDTQDDAIQELIDKRNGDL